MNLGEEMKQRREEKGMSQEELSQIVGCGRSSIAGFERGSYSPSIAVAQEIAKALGTELELKICDLRE